MDSSQRTAVLVSTGRSEEMENLEDEEGKERVEEEGLGQKIKGDEAEIDQEGIETERIGDQTVEGECRRRKGRSRRKGKGEKGT